MALQLVVVPGKDYQHFYLESVTIRYCSFQLIAGGDSGVVSGLFYQKCAQTGHISLKNNRHV
jgi:hypothetical protein